MNLQHITFIGGGNMASAIISGLIQQGHAPQQITVIDPSEEARARLTAACGVDARAVADSMLIDTSLVVWAIKPQTFAEAAQSVATYVQHTLHLSVAAGIRSNSIARWLGTDRIVRAMPNTPALVGHGMTGLFARPEVTQPDRQRAADIIATTGDFVWLTTEDLLDTVTALSGSGPAYVFYWMEAMITAGTEMGLSREQARQLTQATFDGAIALSGASPDSLQTLRQRVTSKGGTTHAAISVMENNDLRAVFIDAMYAARQRAQELGDAFGSA